MKHNNWLNIIAFIPYILTAKINKKTFTGLILSDINQFCKRMLSNTQIGKCFNKKGKRLLPIENYT